MLKIGSHLSSSKGFMHMGEEAISINAGTFQFFTRNPRGGKAKPLDLEDIAKYLEFAKNHEIKQILAHAPYTLNPCAKEEGLREFAFATMQDDLRRLEHIPGAMYNFHPGSHVGQGEKEGIRLITEHLNRLFEEEFSTTVLLETMAGKGSEIGRCFEEIQEIIAGVEHNEKLGVCMDTCHVFDAGYDIVNDLDGILKEFDKIVGLDRLKAVHINDSMNTLGSHKDRHAKIGEGKIGLKAMVRIINHEKLRELPFYLETPNELEGYHKEILLLKSLYKAG